MLPARRVFIPRMCQLEGLSTVGACRLCLVEVKGSNKLLPSCVTHVEEGMEVTTTSERLDQYRKMIVELMFTERNHICSVCVSNGHCELQTMAQKLDITHVRFPYRYPQAEVDASHDRFVIDHNRCILCTRCVRVCDEIEGAHTWDIMGRGIESRVDHAISTSPGDRRKPAPVAANASRFVPQARWSNRAVPWPRWKNAATSCLT